MKTMSVWGIGPKWGVLVLGYAAASIFLGHHYSILVIPEALSAYARVAAVFLLIIGLPLWVVSGRTMFRGVGEGRLLTAGPYAMCRHPIYGSWILFNLPAISLLSRSWLGLTSSVFAYVLLRMMAGAEEDYLLEKFGTPYSAYRRRTPFVLPIGLLKKHPSG